METDEVIKGLGELKHIINSITLSQLSRDDVQGQVMELKELIDDYMAMLNPKFKSLRLK